MSGELQLKAYARGVDARLAALLPSPDVVPSELHMAMRYSGLAAGKRLRPALCLAASAAVGKPAELVLDAACALEMVHCFSLIHDDLPALDNDDLRRGLPTCHVKFGESTAILAGDALFALAFETVASGPWGGEARAEAIRLLAQASSRLVRGETADLLAEGRVIDADTLRYIHANKTGALIAASCEIGAVLAEAQIAHREALRLFGEHIGLAFQIADDVLNETATPEQLGKSAGSDRARGKATYPALYGIERSREMAVQAVEEAYSELQQLPGDVEFLMAMARYSIERLS